MTDTQHDDAELVKRLQVRSFEIEGANGGPKQLPLCGDRCRFMEPNSCRCAAAAHDFRAAAERISALSAALEPFASEAELWDDLPEPPLEDAALWVGSYANRHMTDEAKFTLGDLRRARAALNDKGSDNG